MKILITGINGKLGHELGALSMQAGYKVTGLTRSKVTGLPAELSNSSIECDLLDEQAVDLIQLSNFDAIFHCAWDTRYESYRTSIDNTLWVEASIFLYEKYFSTRENEGVFVGFGSAYQDDQSHAMYKTPYMEAKRQLKSALSKISRNTSGKTVWVPVSNIISSLMSTQQLLPKLIKSKDLTGLINLDKPIFWQLSSHLAKECLTFVKSRKNGFCECFPAQGYKLSISDIVQLAVKCEDRIPDEARGFLCSRATGRYARHHSDDLIKIFKHFNGMYT